jgi:hypothetical protein
MLRRSTYFIACFSLVSERLANREEAVSGSLDGARRKHTPGKEGDMRRITALIVVLATTALIAVFPLAASATHGPPHGGGPINLRAM